MLHCQDKLTICEAIAPATDKQYDTMEYLMLENNVVPYLHLQAKETADQLKTNHWSTLSCDD